MKIKIFILYLSTVGVLFACLLIILTVGKTIEASPDLSGAWKLDARFRKSVQDFCLPMYFSNNNPEISIEQSGIYILATFNDALRTRVLGKIHNGKMLLHKTFVNKNKTKPNLREEINIKVTINFYGKNDEVNALTGNLLSDNSRNCHQIDFTAIKVPNVNEATEK